MAGRPPDTREAKTGSSARELRRLLLDSSLFVLPLRKRKAADRSFSSRVTVVRAVNNDIVLRHPSVSRFHAWFERDASNRFVLGDARSKNGTATDGQTLSPLSPVPLADGTHVRFGSIHAHVCLPTTYWDMGVLT